MIKKISLPTQILDLANVPINNETLELTSSLFETEKEKKN